ncbi:MAG: class I SAM-dependent methyltransferase [Gemmatimonadota bacterium]
MTCSHCKGADTLFSQRMARRDLKKYRKSGASVTTSILLGALLDHGAESSTLLDIGGGIGAIQHAAGDWGAASVTSVDASSAYLEAARQEASLRGYEEKSEYVLGDFVDIAGSVPEADIVTLDRVVCCYPDMPALVGKSASKARRLYGLVFPRPNLVMRAALKILNLSNWLRRIPFRAYVHDPESIAARVHNEGLRKVFTGGTMLWKVELYSRPDRLEA